MDERLMADCQAISGGDVEREERCAAQARIAYRVITALEKIARGYAVKQTSRPPGVEDA